MLKASLNTGRSTECLLRDVGPVLPGNVTSIQYRLIGEPEESYGSGERNVFIITNITWEAPDLKGAGITFYDVRLGREPQEIDDTSDSGDSVTHEEVNKLSIQEQFRYLDVPAGTLKLYLQVSLCIINRTIVLMMQNYSADDAEL